MAAQEELAGAGGQLQVAELVTWQARFPGPEVIEVSGNAVEVLGYASEALLGPLEAFLVHVHAEERDEARRVIEGLNAGESISFECRAVRLGGDEIRVRHVAFRSSDDGGRLAGAVVDLTESITAHALLGAEAKTRAILDTAVDGIIAIDDVGLIQSTNPAAMKLFGYAEEELLGRNVSMLMPEPYRSEHDGYLANYKETGQKRIIGIGREVEGLRRDGTRFPMYLAVGEADVDGRRLFTGIVRDLTEVKRTEEALRDTQKLESLAVLAGGIAHDFNNLLVGILGNASLALEELPPDSPIREHLQDVQTSAQRAAELARQMLAYSGRGQFIIEDVDLNSLVEETGQLLRITVASGTTFQYQLEPSLPPVEGDATQLRQVLMNLVMNASDALGDDAGLVTIRTGMTTVDHVYLAGTYLGADIAEGTYVSIEVSDSGVGMSPEVMERMFDPFFTTKFTGRGLGLAAVLGIVRAHHGTIRVQSEPGKGTTVQLLLPPSPNAAVTASTGTEAKATTGVTVLVIDDEVAARRVAERTLRSAGIGVLVAENGERGVAILEREGSGIGLVLLDLTMPDQSGVTTYSRLRRRNRDVPVLLMSGYSEEEATAAFAGKGIAGFLQKPYVPDELRAKVREILEAVDAD